MSTVTTFGELMLRLSTKSSERLVQASELQTVYGGAEANVAISLGWLGIDSQFVTRLPENALGRACIHWLRQHGVGTENISWGGERLGLYFLEVGAAQRNSSVIYDRNNSSFATSPIDTFDWSKILSQSQWFHWSGITPALSEGTYRITKDALSFATNNSVKVSCDLNYRSKLWKWGHSPVDVMPHLVTHCDLLVAGMYDAVVMLDIEMPAVDDPLEAQTIMFDRIHEKFPQLQTIATTVRTDTTSSKTTIQGLMWHAGEIYTGNTYIISDIVDRVGSGDAFSAALIHGFLREKDPQDIIEFATAAACLKHSIVGDANLVTEDEILALATSGATGRVRR